jgi:hypothetical protein
MESFYMKTFFMSRAGRFGRGALDGPLCFATEVPRVCSSRSTEQALRSRISRRAFESCREVLRATGVQRILGALTPQRLFGRRNWHEISFLPPNAQEVAIWEP